MRVAHLTTVDLSLRYLLLPQLEAVIELGGEVIGISAPGPYVRELEERGIRHIPLAYSTRSINPTADLKAAFALWRILRREKPDVLHTHTPKPGIYGRIVGRLAGVPVVANTIHGLYATEDDRLTKRLLVYLAEAIAGRFSDRELVQSAEDFDLVTRKRITRPERTRLLGNGVDLSRFDRTRVPEPRRLGLRESIGAGPEDVVVGSVGRLVAEKGFPEFFEAAASLSRRCVVVAIGPFEPDKDDGLSSDDVSRAEEAGVRLLGMQTNVDEWYAAMDIFVLASHREGFPRAAMEAAASALPVIATDIRGCREVVEHEATGLLVPVRNPAAIREAIDRLAGSAELRTRMGKAARAKALKDFNEDDVVNRVISAQIGALREKGIFPRLPAQDIGYRTSRPEDAATIARLHVDAIATGFLPTLGAGFLRRLYAAMIGSPGSRLIVAHDEYGPIGFVAGVPDVDDFYRLFVRRHGVKAGLSAVPALIRPSTWRKAWETSQYEGGHHETPAELLSMAVADGYRGSGIGRELAARLLDEFEGDGITRVKVVVGEANTGARRTYESVGFRAVDTVEVHRGETSLVMVSDRSI